MPNLAIACNGKKEEEKRYDEWPEQQYSLNNFLVDGFSHCLAHGAYV